MTKKYTAADFANARFAEHENGNLAMRDVRGSVEGWSTEIAFGGIRRVSDEHMARNGWVPVPTKPTITESALEEFYIAAHEIDGRVSIEETARSIGYEIIPDPEPTSTELIADALIDGFERDEFTLTSSFRVIAASLATRGITAPNVKDN